MVTSTILAKYSHIHRQATLVRPHALSEVEALRMFRLHGTANGQSCGRVQAPPPVEVLGSRVGSEVNDMLRAGWKRNADVFINNLDALNVMNRRALERAMST